MKLKRLMALVMSIALALASSPFVSVAAQGVKPVVSSQSQLIQATGLVISGTVVRSDRKTPVEDACLRLRKVETKDIIARTISGENGAFSFTVPEPGMYLVEAVDCRDAGVLAVSDALSLASSPLTLTTLVVLPSAVEAGFLTSTAFIVLAAASAAGITAVAIAAGGSDQAVSSPEQ